MREYLRFSRCTAVSYGLLQIRRPSGGLSNHPVKVITQELRTGVTSMSIKHSKVHYCAISRFLLRRFKVQNDLKPVFIICSAQTTVRRLAKRQKTLLHEVWFQHSLNFRFFYLFRQFLWSDLCLKSFLEHFVVPIASLRKTIYVVPERTFEGVL